MQPPVLSLKTGACHRHLKHTRRFGSVEYSLQIIFKVAVSEVCANIKKHYGLPSGRGAALSVKLAEPAAALNTEGPMGKGSLGLNCSIS